MGFCYPQLYDVEQEVNGLYTYAREKKFADYSRIIAANRKKAAIEEQPHSIIYPPAYRAVCQRADMLILSFEYSHALTCRVNIDFNIFYLC